MLELKNRREVLWDRFLEEESRGLTVVMHRPEYRGTAYSADAPWEGNTTGYFALANGEKDLRLYYRACNMDVAEDLSEISHKPAFCLCLSEDGKTFRRAEINRVPFGEITENNIVFDQTNDNFTIFRDTNPACPEDERWKALSGTDDRRLMYYKSRDGIEFEFVRELVGDGNYDSMNVAFWDETAGLYRLYYRGLHDEVGADFKWGRPQVGGPIRDIRVKTSPDFVTWSESVRLDYGEGAPDLQMYTNQVRPYYRAPHMLLGIPTRYTDRAEDEINFRDLPDREHRARVTAKWDRCGTAMTDCCLMTSRDGVRFNRCDEAFLTPGPERTLNWYYGDCYTALGMAETASAREGAPNEISIYMGENYRASNVCLARYALRLDGFFSWHGDFSGAEVTTKPFTFEGDALEINFATSSLGHVRIRLLSEDGQELAGYDSGRLFGDSVNRPARFEKDLRLLRGQPVRMKIELKDADLYSFRFTDVSENK